MAAPPPPARPGAALVTALLEAEGLVRTYQGVRAVDGLSLQVAEGSITGLIGPNGSGKSTTIDLLTGFQRADAGAWRLAGSALTGLAPHAIARAGLVRTFQTVRAFEELSVLDNLLQAASGAARTGLWARYLGSAASRAAEEEARVRAHGLLELVGLAAHAGSPAGRLSYGQHKLLALAACLMGRPRLLVLDEPVAGVNPTMVRVIEDVLRRIANQGTTLLLVEHNMDFVMRLCSHVIVLDAGRMLVEGEARTVREHPMVLEAYLGGAGATHA